MEIIPPVARERALVSGIDMLPSRRAASAHQVVGGTASYIAQQIGQMMAEDAPGDEACATAAAAYRRADEMAGPWTGYAVVLMPSARLSV